MNNDPHYHFELKPYRSLGVFGQRNALWLLMILTLVLVPPIVVWGSKLLLFFVLSPAFMLTLAFFAINKAHRLREILDITPKKLTLKRIEPNGKEQIFETDPYWVKIQLSDKGPVSKYLTLKDQHRHVELGSFLPQEEREALYLELLRIQNRVRSCYNKES